MILSIEHIKKRLEKGTVYRSEPMQIVHAHVDGVPVKFCVTSPEDTVQQKHWNGKFYELAELMALRKIFPEGGTFLDVGANIGNHSLCAALIWKAAHIVPIEPNPLAYHTLLQNILVNGVIDKFDLSHIGIGLSDEAKSGFGMQKRKRNLGAAKMLEGEGDLTVERGDVRLAGLKPDLIKIDVEGMELPALRGMEGLFADQRPPILIEVENKCADEFFEWADGKDYVRAATVRRYTVNQNHLMVQKDQLDAVQTALQGTKLEATA